MSTTTTLHSYALTALPYTTTALMTLGLGTSLSMLLSSSPSAARLFGFSPSSPSKLRPATEADARARSYIQIHALRNMASGMGTLGLLGYRYWGCEGQAKEVVGRCVGILMVVGSVVAVGDGVVLRGYVGAEGVGEEGRRRGVEKSNGHFGAGVMILVIGMGWLLL
ncbi:hypothetical protein EJ04DRAFT_607125 [Polyplosphaeria fusca]|uniref:Uncharacterized protein n=1 Tax=Polyplosphaeria fusca TaxID=682080 RepID=A0A9P4QXA5_9PLEO|nr:hypothetical protein EJ04DRAFT_607125 [Polyplosphaeria fusca]